MISVSGRIAVAQDKLLREAAEAFYRESRRCEDCGSFSVVDYRDDNGITQRNACNWCGELECVLSHDAPACEGWWED